MKKGAYYNEFDPYAAQWLRSLISKGLIAGGDVDERSIEEIKPDELKGYTQCHFFAGIGGWSLALRYAGWDDSRFVWTGSCPCQPFSSAGKQKGTDDERHLWPVWENLIAECKPSVVFGEQVASAIAYGWWDGVASGLEAQGYSCAAAVLPACSVGRPHRRDRLWFVGNAELPRPHGGSIAGSIGEGKDKGRMQQSERPDTSCDVAYSERTAAAGRSGCKTIGGGSVYSGESTSQQRSIAPDNAGDSRGGNGDVADRAITGLEGWAGEELQRGGARPTQLGGSDIEWVECPDGKVRPIEPRIPLLAHGVSGRMVIRRTEWCEQKEKEHYYSRKGAIRGLGNAIVPQVAAQFIRAFMDVG